MDATQALRELMELSSQITTAVVLDAEGTVLAGAPDDSAAPTMLAATTLELDLDARHVAAVGAEIRSRRNELERCGCQHGRGR